MGGRENHGAGEFECQHERELGVNDEISLTCMNKNNDLED
jgi:hypothetical protein